MALRRTSLGIGVVLGVLLLVLAVRSVDPAGLRQSLSSTSPWLVVLGLLTVAGTVIAKALRWRLLFPPSDEAIRLSSLVSALLIGQTVNLLLPARLGELARAYLVGETENREALLALGTIVVEKALDGLALVLLLVILFVVMPLPDWLRLSGALTALVTAAILAVVLLLTRQRHRVLNAADGLCRLLPVLNRLGLRRRMESLARGLSALESGRVSMRALVWTACIWLLAASTNYFILLALHIETPLVLASLVVLVVLHLGLVVPTSPARIGVFHYLCLLSLSLLGVEESLALAYGFVLHFVVVLPVISAGLLCLWKENLSLYRLVSEAEGG